MKKIPYSAYALVLLAIYVFLASLLPEYASRALFSVPILITLGVGYLGGWREGMITAVLGLLTAFLILFLGIIPTTDPIYIRAIPYIIIVSGIVYTQRLKDNFDSATTQMSTQDKRLSIISD